MNDDEAVEKYIVRPGTTNFGEKYELIFTVLIALQLSFDNAIKNFKISTNDSFWCDFDDSVFEIEHKDGKKIILAFQLKHVRQNITLENVTNSKGDYSLDKYYKSYKKIMESYNSKEIKNVYCILYTTGGYSKNIEEFQWHHHEVKKSDCVLQPVPSGNECFQFHCGDVSSKSEFLSRFFIYTNQKNCSNTESAIRSLIHKKFRIRLDISEDLFGFMDNWRKGQLGSHYKLTRDEFVSEMCALLLTPQIVQPSFKTENLNFINLWNEAVKSVDITFVENLHKTASKIWCALFHKINFGHEWNKDNWMMASINVKEIGLGIPLRYLLNQAKDNKVSLKNVYIASWKSGLVPLLLKIDIPYDALSEIFEFVLSTEKKKYFVIWISHKNNQYFEKFSKFANLSDLAKFKIFQRILTELHISIQNRFRISINEIQDLDKTFLFDLTPDTFLEILENNIVGIMDIQVPEIYIERRISVAHVDLNVLKYIRDDVIFVLCDLNNHYDYIEKRFSSRIVEFTDLETDTFIAEKNIIIADYNLSMNSVKSFLNKLQNKYHVFLMTERLGSFTLKWLDSTASVDLLKEFAVQQENVDEEDFLLNAHNPTNVISSPSGMGKTALINQMCRTCSQNVWIFKIELMEHSKYFEEQQNVAEPLTYFCNYFYGNSKLSRICFDSFARTKKVVFLLDGFDEISPKFTDTVLEIIKYFKSNKFTQWITTRPTTAHILERKFNILSHSICPFNTEEKIFFIKRYSNSVSLNFQKLFCEALVSFISKAIHYSDNALQMSMLCETVKNNISTTNTSEFRIVDILELYTKFIEIKFCHYERKYLKGCDPIIYDDLTEKLRDINVSNHQICSLIVVFGHHQVAPFIKDHNMKFLEKVQQGEEKIGIITQVSSDFLPIFLHQSYAEYFVAMWLAENWKTNKRVTKILKLVLSSKLYSKVRIFFDRILSRGVDLFEAVLEQDLEKIQKCSSEDFQHLDDLGRNALHLACSWKPKTDTKYIDFLLHKIDPKSGCDKLFNSTPIVYADKAKNVVIIDKILQLYYFDISKLKICANIKGLMYKCIKKKCIILLSTFAVYLNSLKTWIITADTAYYDNLLFTAIETNNVAIVKVLLCIKEFRKHVKNTKTHGNAALQLAILLENEKIATNLIDFKPQLFTSTRPTSYEIALEESSGDIKQMLTTTKDM